jgi:hypothetical protein
MAKRKFNVAVVLILLTTVIITWPAGCAKDKEAQVPALGGKSGFPVNSALIGAAYKIAGTDKSVHPPVNFAVAPDTILQLLQRNFEQGKGTAKGIKLVQCFLDTIHVSGLLVTTIEGLDLSADTALFMSWYRQSLVDIYGIQNVHEGSSQVNDIVIRSFLASDSAEFRYQFLCIAPAGNAVELNFFGPRNVYAQLARSFESAVGTITTVRP